MTQGSRRAGGIAAMLVVSALTACAGGDPSDEPSAAGPSATTSESVAGATDSATPEAYLPVPDGVELTAQGTELDFREPAVVAWEPRQDLVGVLDVTVKRVEQTTFAESFEGWQIDAATRRSTPYFVRATIGNVGESEIGGRDVPLYAVGVDDTLVEASSFATRFEPCPGNGLFPEAFGPGETAEFCLVYLVPDGGEVEAVGFRPTQDFQPITWTGKVKEPATTGEKGPTGRPDRG